MKEFLQDSKDENEGTRRSIMLWDWKDGSGWNPSTKLKPG